MGIDHDPVGGRRQRLAGAETPPKRKPERQPKDQAMCTSVAAVLQS